VFGARVCDMGASHLSHLTRLKVRLVQVPFRVSYGFFGPREEASFCKGDWGMGWGWGCEGLDSALMCPGALKGCAVPPVAPVKPDSPQGAVRQRVSYQKDYGKGVFTWWI
jgi:hypothetical protein